VLLSVAYLRCGIKLQKQRRWSGEQRYNPTLIIEDDEATNEDDEQTQADLEGLEHDLGMRISISRYAVNDQDSKELLEQLL
jgi:hypothetical protein